MNKYKGGSKLRCAQKRENKHKKSKFQQNGTPPWQRGFDRGLNLRAGGIFFPNQNFQGGNDELTRRIRQYADPLPVGQWWQRLTSYQANTGLAVQLKTVASGTPTAFTVIMDNASCPAI